MNMLKTLKDFIPLKFENIGLKIANIYEHSKNI